MNVLHSMKKMDEPSSCVEPLDPLAQMALDMFLAQPMHRLSASEPRPLLPTSFVAPSIAQQARVMSKSDVATIVADAKARLKRYTDNIKTVLLCAAERRCMICGGLYARSSPTERERQVLTLVEALRESPEPEERKQKILADYYDHVFGQPSHDMRLTRADVLAHVQLPSPFREQTRKAMFPTKLPTFATWDLEPADDARLPPPTEETQV